MKILGLSCGRKMGNSEMLLREALLGAEELGAEVEIIRLHDLNIKPCTGCETCVKKGLMGDEKENYKCIIKNDDMPYLLDKLWKSNGQIISAPSYTYNPPGYFRLVLDRLHSVGRRWPKPIPGAVICVGGSDWVNLCLPMTSDWFNRIGGKLVDQMVVPFTARPAQVLLNKEAMARARRLGRNMGKAVKLPFNKVKYIGDGMKVSEVEMEFYARTMNLSKDFVKYVMEEEEACPLCHMNLLQLRGKYVRCAMCDIRGTIEIDENKIKIKYDEEEIQKRRRESFEEERHMHIVESSFRIYEEKENEIAERREKYRSIHASKPDR